MTPQKLMQERVKMYDFNIFVVFFFGNKVSIYITDCKCFVIHRLFGFYLGVHN